MPASCRRLRLLSNFVLRDGRISRQREAGFSGLSSLSGDHCLNGATKSIRTATSIRPISFFADRGRYRQLSESTGGCMSNSVSQPSITDLEYVRTSVKTASFHSSPVSSFAEESGDKSDDATTTEAAATNEDASAGDNISGDDSGDDKEPSATDIEYHFSPPAPLSQASQDKVQAIFDKVLWLDMIEVHLLTQIVNERMGISWRETEMRQRGGGFVQAAGSGGGAAAEAEAAEEKTVFDLKLVGFDAKAKIKVIKEVRSMAGLGLKEAKELVEGVPKVIQKELKQEQAEELKAQLEAVGAQVELV
mmetsp:Transcript_24/g.39  ORF Transcript_24/g.39 Transcript_24/m.39 type:complete len:305 (-) Transcript_24:356-1270(-)|eukprot:CAMPEP_0172370094 /NCGR_PEP_ID=MMETSP1060-20121228/36260_1 /TAXON_ID=37318 /ORGANISM="Pseudo-nitzschia pungens, Strain cf. cingulata" /LENGTH=304 /DNA_ID=CAMNT_0013095263 /DNA_START=200 /DNA_END=1114 /DNA_ORIENTATION=+